MTMYTYNLPENCFFNGEYMADTTDDEEVRDFIMFATAWYAKYPNDKVYQAGFGLSYDALVKHNNKNIWVEYKFRGTKKYDDARMRRRKSDELLGFYEQLKIAHPESDDKVVYASVWKEGIITIGEVQKRKNKLLQTINSESDNDVTAYKVKEGKWIVSNDGKVYTAEDNYEITSVFEIKVPVSVWNDRHKIKKDTTDILDRNKKYIEKIQTEFRYKKNDSDRRISEYKK